MPRHTYALSVAVWLCVAGLLVALGVTDLGAALSADARSHAAIQSCGALVLSLAALFVFGRLYAAARAHGSRLESAPQRVSDVVLAPALGLLAVTTVVFSAVPTIVSTTPGAFAIWGQSLGDIAGVGAAAVAAWVPAGRVIHRRVTAWETVGVIAAAMALVALAALAASPALPTPYQRASTLQADWLPTQIILIGLIAIACVGFARRAVRDGDRLMTGFAISAPLAAGATIASAAGPALGPGWLVIQELLLFGAYGAIFVGAWSEWAAYWRRVVELAGAEERRRMARDLHDGLAQDLTYIAMHTRALVDRHPDADGLRQVMHVSERALDESRGAIGALACAPGESLARVLASSVREVASRSGAVASVHVDDEVEPSVEVREAVLRVAREATSNAARHGRATRVVVTLEGGEALRLTVSDNGVGFDAQGARLAGCGFGLESMQERARAVGGTLSVRSRRGEGTEITATLPCDRPRLVLAR
jgi:signal transduction histidine kinase